MSRKQYDRPLKKMPTAQTRCRECGNPLTTPATAKRGMCRSCWRVAKVVTTG
jgi:ribosomal protein S14